MAEVVQLYKDEAMTEPISPIVSGDSIALGNSNLTETVNAINNKLNNYYTKSEVKNLINSISFLPDMTKPASIARLFNDTSSSWRDFCTHWVAPSNGFIYTYFTGASGTPSMEWDDVTTNREVNRAKGNGSRDVGLLAPVIKGHEYYGRCVYCYPEYIVFWPAITV